MSDYFMFILDGGPTQATCYLESCESPSVGTFEVVDDYSGETVSSANLCHQHAKQIGTGYFGDGL